MADVFSEVPIKGLLEHNVDSSTGDRFAGVLPALVDNLNPSLTDGKAALLSMTTRGELRVTDASTATRRVLINDSTGLVMVSPTTAAPNSATNPFFFKAADSTGILQVSPTTSAHSATNPFFVKQVDSTGIQMVSGTTAINALANPIWTRLSDGSSALGTASNPVHVISEENVGTADSTRVTTSAVAAGAASTLSSTKLAAGAGLTEFTAAASVRIKVDLKTVVDATTTIWRTFFVPANDTLIYNPKDVDFISLVGGSTRRFKAVITNMDNANAADVYASFGWTV